MSFGSGQHSDSLSDGGFKLLVELVHGDLVHEVLHVLLVRLDLESDTDVDFDKDVVVGGAGFDR